jgi:hypothetical protein
MEELSLDLLDELEREPASKPKKSKIIERTHRTWFYGIATHLGKCDNDDCTDERKKPQIMVWTTKEGLDMCRYCFLGGWLESDS